MLLFSTFLTCKSKMRVSKSSTICQTTTLRNKEPDLLQDHLQVLAQLEHFTTELLRSVEATGSEREQSYFKVAQLSCPSSCCSISHSPLPFTVCINCLAQFNISTPQRLPHGIWHSHLEILHFKAKCTNVISLHRNCIFLPIKGYCIVTWMLYYHINLLNNQEKATKT